MTERSSRTSHGDAIYVYSDALVDFQITNSVFTDIGGYGIELYSDDKDMNFVMNNVTMVNVDNEATSMSIPTMVA